MNDVTKLVDLMPANVTALTAMPAEKKAILNALQVAKSDDASSELAALGYGPVLPMESATLPWPWDK